MSYLRVVDYSRRGPGSLVDYLSDTMDPNTEVIMPNENTENIPDDANVDITDSVDMQNDVAEMAADEAEIQAADNQINNDIESTDVIEDSISTASDLEEQVVEDNNPPTSEEVNTVIAQESAVLALLSGQRDFAKALALQSSFTESLQRAPAFRGLRFMSNPDALRYASRNFNSIGYHSLESMRQGSYVSKLERIQYFKEGAKEYLWAFYDAIIAGIRKLIILLKKAWQKALLWLNKFEKDATSLEAKLKDVGDRGGWESLEQEKQKELVGKIKEKIPQAVAAVVGVHYINNIKTNASTLSIENMINIEKLANELNAELSTNNLIKNMNGLTKKVKLDDISNVGSKVKELENSIAYKITKTIDWTLDSVEYLKVEVGEKETIYVTRFDKDKLRGIKVKTEDNGNGISGTENVEYGGNVKDNLTQYFEKQAEDKLIKYMGELLGAKEKVKSCISQLKNAKKKVEDNNNKCLDILDGVQSVLEACKSKNRISEEDETKFKETQSTLKGLVAVFKKAANDGLSGYMGLFTSTSVFAANYLAALPKASELKKEDKKDENKTEDKKDQNQAEETKKEE